MNSYDYRRLGVLCNNYGSILVDNKKYFPIDDPLYKKPYTYMMEYPLEKSIIHPKVDIERPEELKKNDGKSIPEVEAYRTKSCCGSK